MQCELACSWVQTGTFQPSHSTIRVSVFDEEASYAPQACHQCDEAWCMTACPVNAIAVDPDTEAKIVIESHCIGCHLCTLVCPFGAIYTSPKSDLASKCNLCAGDPACATACPTDAIEYVESDSDGKWLQRWGETVHQGFMATTAGAK